MAISKLGFLGSPGIVFESNLVEIVKNLQEAQVWCKTMKKKIWEGFNLVWPSVKPRVDQGHFGHFSWKRHFGCFDAWMGCATSFCMFSQPHGEKILFWNFLRSSMQIEGEQNTVSTTASSLSNTLSAIRGVR